MQITHVGPALLPAFEAYSRRYGPEHDDSWLPEPGFVADDDNPSYVALDAGGAVAGAASLMLTPAYRAAGKGRFRIFHVADGSPATYRRLLAALLPHAAGVQSIYLFVPQSRTATREALVEIGFAVERYSWMLRRPPASASPPEFPTGFVLRPLRDGDVDAYCDLVNDAFATAEGHIDLLPAGVRRMLNERWHIPEGMLLLWETTAAGEYAVGTVRMVRQTEPGQEGDEPTAYVEGLAVRPAYQGRGLGRALLRAGLQVAERLGLPEALLSVAATNAGAIRLYESEGFVPESVYVCYARGTGPL